METNGAGGSGNRYCRRLGVPLPDLEGALAGHDVKLSHLMALALLEAGGPMSLEAITERLGRLDLPPRLARAADPAALLKAWHGQGPLVRDPVDGLFYLDLLSHHEVGYIAAIANPARHAAARRAPEEFRQPPDTEPVTQEEVDAAFKRRMLFTYSSVRQAAAILEAAGGGPLPLEEVNRRLKALTQWGGIDERNVAAWRSDLVRADADGLLHLNTASMDAPKMRRDVRKMALATLRQRAQVVRARCLDGARASPPEDCGGPDGYERLLEILFDPRHPEFENTRRWAGGFEPERFDARAASAAMARVPWF